MKKTLAIILALILCVSMLSGCGGKGNNNVTNTSEKTYSTGDFSFLVPAGWLEIPFTLNGEPNPTAAGVYKGAKTEFDMLTKPGFQINCPSSGARISASKSWYDNVSDLEPLKLSNYTWEGFTGEMVGTPYAVLWDADKKDDFQVTVCLENGSKISLDDADVLSILGSIKLERARTSEESAAPTTAPDTVPAAATPEGKYNLIVYEINGEDMFEFFASMYDDEFDPDSLYIEFKSNGKCQLSMDEDPIEGTYEMDGDTITIDVDGDIMQGVFDRDRITIESNDSGNTMQLVFEKGGVLSFTPKTPSVEEDTVTAAQEKWNGIWYGYLWYVESFGAYYDEEDDDELYDAFMEIDIDENGEGTMTAYLGFSGVYYSFDSLSNRVFIEADIIADEYHFEVTEGDFLNDYEDMPLDPAIWWLGLSSLTDEPTVAISDTYIDSDDDGFEFMLVFRPYGSSWEDQMGSNSNYKVPLGYDGYLEELDSGLTVGGGSAGDSGDWPSGGDGIVDIKTYNEFKEILDEIASLSFGIGADPVTYDDVVELFGGVEGHFQDTYIGYVNYEWYVADNGGGAVISFDIEDDELVYSAYSASSYITPANP